MSKMIYSDIIGYDIHKGFTRGKYHYTWNEYDAFYYRDDVDDDYVFYDVAEALAEANKIKWD